MLAQNAISPLLLIVVTRVNGIADSGIFSFAFATALIFWSLSMWGGRTYQVSDVSQEFTNSRYITSRIVVSSVVVLLSFGFVILNHYDLVKSLIIIVFTLTKCIESIADSLYGVLQTNNKLYLSGKSLVYKAVLSLGVFALIDFSTKDLLLSCVAYLIATVVVTLIYDLRHARGLEKISMYGEVQLKAIFLTLKRSSPVLATTFLAMLTLNIPRYFIDMFHQNELGYFGILAMPGTLIVLFMSFILQPQIVELAQRFKAGDYRTFSSIIQKISQTSLTVGAAVILGAYIAGVPVLNYIFGIGFDGYKLAMILMLVGSVINSQAAIFMNALTITREFRTQLVSLLVANTIALVLSLLLISSYGVISGVVCYVVACLVQAVIVFMAYKSKLRQHTNNQ